VIKMSGIQIEYLVGLYFVGSGIDRTPNLYFVGSGIDRTPNWFKIAFGAVLLLLAFLKVSMV
jgi:hypothetical protein